MNAKNIISIKFRKAGVTSATEWPPALRGQTLYTWTAWGGRGAGFGAAEGFAWKTNPENDPTPARWMARMAPFGEVVSATGKTRREAVTNAIGKCKQTGGEK